MKVDFTGYEGNHVGTLSYEDGKFAWIGDKVAGESVMKLVHSDMILWGDESITKKNPERMLEMLYLYYDSRCFSASKVKKNAYRGLTII